MQRKFILNLILLLVLNFLVKPFYIVGIDAEILDRVGEAIYGDYFAILGFTILFNIILDMGIVNYNTRNIARNAEDVQRDFSGIFTLRLILVIPYALICLAGAALMDYNITGLLPWLIANQVLIAFILYFRSVLSGLLQFAKDSFVSVLDRILLIIICASLLWGGVTDQPFQIEWFVYAQTGCYAISAFVAFLFILPKVGGLRFRFRPKAAWNTLKLSSPFALLIVLMIFYHRSDSVMLEKLVDANEAGKYAQGYRLFEALNMVIYMFASLLLPMFARMLKHKEDVQKLLLLAVKLLFSGGLIIGVSSYFYRAHIIDFRYDSTSLVADNAFGMLMISFFIFSTTFLFSTLLTAAGNMRALNITSAIGLGLNIVLNFILIPDMGAYGAAIASVVTQSMAGLAQVFIVQRSFRFPVNSGLLIRMGGLTLLAFAVGIYFHYWVEWEWNVEFITMLGVLTAACLGTNLLNPLHLLTIIRKRDNKLTKS